MIFSVSVVCTEYRILLYFSHSRYIAIIVDRQFTEADRAIIAADSRRAGLLCVTTHRMHAHTQHNSLTARTLTPQHTHTIQYTQSTIHYSHQS